ncbi:MAG: hypothetical protein ABSG70_15475 [Terriglobales bacterium]|jgi:hypothetical protein
MCGADTPVRDRLILCGRVPQVSRLFETWDSTTPFLKNFEILGALGVSAVNKPGRRPFRQNTHIRRILFRSEQY